VLDCVQAFRLGTIPRLHFWWQRDLYTEPEYYKHHTLEALASPSKNGSWSVEVTVSWLAAAAENRMKCGPYHGFIFHPSKLNHGE
jgi:hypothetical protein